MDTTRPERRKLMADIARALLAAVNVILATETATGGTLEDIDSYYEYISQYWKNPITRPTKQSEILFEGVAKCIRILKEETVGKSNTWDEMTIRK